MKISHLLSTKPPGVVTIQPGRTVADAVQAMVQRNIGALVVVNSRGNVVGIISERDVVRAAARTRSVLDLRVVEVMTRQVVVGTPQDDLMAVAHTMTEKRFRHLPIMIGDKLVGMVSIGDVLKSQRDEYVGQIDTLEEQIMADEE